MKAALILLAAATPLLADLVLTESFEGDSPLASWQTPGSASLSEGAMRVHLATQGDALASLPLPLEKLRGCRIEISARVKLENVVKAAESWHGAKLMLQTESPSGTKYQSIPQLAGLSDWKEVGLAAEVPPDATSAQLRLGLGQASGTAWFDDIAIRTTAGPFPRPSPQPTLLPPEKLDRRTSVPRFRGVMYGPHFKEGDLRKLAEWKVNLIRWHLYYHDAKDPEKRLDLAAYDRWLDKTMDELDRALPLCRELGISLVIDLHTPPGGNDGGQMAVFSDPACQEKFIACWDRLVERYKNEPAVWAYDLLNEPIESRTGPGLRDWRSLADFVARRVRAADPHKAIIVEPGPHGGWENLPFFPPLTVPGIIYSVHMYEPLSFTHQGIFEGLPKGVSYPGTIDGKFWDKETLRQTLEPVRRYQKDFNVPIYIGEFSAPRWAPGESTATWLRDCIALFEEYGWDWSYHTFREWHPWNVELGPDAADQTVTQTPSTRQQTLRADFSKNAAEQ